MLDAFWPELGKIELDRFLAKYFRDQLKGAGKRDRQWYAELIFGFFRNVVRVTGPVSRTRAREMLREWGAEKALSLYSEHIEGPQAPQLFAEDLPRFERRQELSRWSDEQAKRFLKNLTRQAPLWVRIPGEGARQLEDRALLQTLPEGTQIQDLASQKIGAAVGAKPGEVILDFCAGAGGKTLQLADDLRGEGQVVATDLRPHALEKILERATPLQKKVIRIETRVSPNQKFDAVLVDAPCTGSGGWRRRPDQMLLADVEFYVKIQRELLQKAQAYVRLGGRLIYATCSWFPEENEEHVPNVQSQMLGSPNDDSDTMFVATV